MRELSLFFLAVINLFSLFVCAFDKNRAIKGKRRVRESTLWRLVFCFGATGMLLGMKMFRHKTQKPAFSIGVPIVLVIQWIVLILFVF